MMVVSKLNKLKEFSIVAVDSCDVVCVKELHPTDCTTNPSLILKAVTLSSCQEVLEEATKWGNLQSGSKEEIIKATADRVKVLLGVKLSEVVPGRISTEVDADLSFDVAKTVSSAVSIVDLYEVFKVARERVLVKIAATWEGILAAEILEKQGINTNLTLVFSLVQAQACAQVGAFLVSPFVGRVGDWYEKNSICSSDLEETPGVLLVREIYNCYRLHGFETDVMAASLRSIDQVEALAGCDRLTIPIWLLEQLSCDMGALTCRFNSHSVPASVPNYGKISEAGFRWTMNMDAMATEKLADGIRLFFGDLQKLRKSIEMRLNF